jgi:hypothetical protein
MEFNRDMEPQRIFFWRVDMIQIVNVVKATMRNWSRYGQIVNNTRSVLNTLQSWLVIHSKRDVQKLILLCMGYLKQLSN